uniref:Uncharacterized protein n=1 Tax=Seriola dumerili TaxID=41447 RepID=A0A3B4V230_SERDU
CQFTISPLIKSPFRRLGGKPVPSLHSSLVDTDGLVAPLFQFDRQAPARISTSPTLRRMRSTRRPLIDSRDPVRMGSTQEEPSSAGTPPPIRPLSPVHRVKSPLAASPLSEGEICHDYQPISSSGRQRTRSHRSKTFDSGITSTRQELHPSCASSATVQAQEQKCSHCMRGYVMCC